MATRNVNEMPSAERKAFETLLGRPLDPDQQVFVMAYTPNVVPDSAIRAAVRMHLERTFEAVDRHAEENGISAQEAEAAVDEAMDQIRPRRPSN